MSNPALGQPRLAHTPAADNTRLRALRWLRRRGHDDIAAILGLVPPPPDRLRAEHGGAQ